MKIKITIDCEPTIGDTKIHLSVCREQIIKALKISEKEGDEGDILISDNNCYGSHDIKITFE